MDLYEEFVAVIDLLDDNGIDYAICGGIAVALHGYPVVSASGLAKMKRIAGRDQDLLDLKKLGLIGDE